MLKSLKKLLLIGFLILVFGPAPALAKESATFFSDIQINHDASLTIKETISYFTSQPHHGIYRYIPTNSREIVKLISITDPNNHPYQVTTSHQNGNVVYKIGDPDITFTGKKIYVITYQVKYPVHKVKDHLELYWDITGEGWKFPLTKVQAIIHSPAPITKSACYSGRYGSNDHLCHLSKINQKTIKVSYPKEINWNQNLTVALAFPLKAGITPPSATFYLTREIIFIIFLIIPTILFFLYWWSKGRDYLPDSSGRKKGLFQHLPIPITAYEPPKDISPGQLGLIIDEKVDSRDVIAEIVELARKKYLKIEKEVKKHFLGHKTDYIFIKLKDADDKLSQYQKNLLNNIFKKKDKVGLEELKKNDFYLTFNQVKQQIYKSAVKKYFSRNPQTDRIKGVIIVFVILFWQIFLLSQTGSLLSFPASRIGGIIALTVFLSNLIDVLMAWNLPQKTALGTKVYLFAKGLKENLKRGAWRDSIKEKHLFIEEIIPYAIALGTIKQLARDMKKLNIEPPDYITPFVGYNTIEIENSLNEFTHITTNSLSTNPSSGSGFSGGFSGGGGGGGGGGSW